MANTLSKRWYETNIHLICSEYSHSLIEYDSEDCTWIRIRDFPLPPSFVQSYTRLLLLLPGINQAISVPPKGFYINQGLRTTEGPPGHVFDHTSYHGAENLTKQGYAYHCVLLRRWWPTADVLSGDNLITVLNTIHLRLATA